MLSKSARFAAAIVLAGALACSALCLFSSRGLTAGYDSAIGSICLWPLSWPPQDWMLCRGQLLSVAEYTPLFAIIGTTYGGDGRTTFALPDLRGRVPIGFGQGPGLSNYTCGQTVGSRTVSLTPGQTPVSVGAVTLDPEEFTDNGTASVVLTRAGTVAPTQQKTLGGSQPHDNMQPYLGLNYIICVNGTWPNRP